MDSFLYTVATRLLEAHPDNFDGVTVVFNNRRAGLFLNREITKLKNEQLGQSSTPSTYIMPRVVGIDDLIAELGGLQIVPNEFLLFELYDIHRGLKEVGRRFESFEEFIPFGEMLLADFSEIDLYRVDPNEILKNLLEIKQMGEWDVSGCKRTPLQEKYITFYSSLIHYYTAIHERLMARGQAYAGMAYRHVADNIDSMIDRQFPAHEKSSYRQANAPHIWFVGFNALSACESTIMDHYVRRGIGTVIFDGDDYYYSDHSQEAGHFLNKFASRYPGNTAFVNHFTEKKNITIINCPENILQAKKAGQILAELFPATDPDKKEASQQEEDKSVNDKQEKTDTPPLTALVLADESMLVPVLNSIPPTVGKANVTMGFPFVYTSIHLLASNIIQLYQHGKGSKYHHSEVTAVLCDNLIAKVLQWEQVRATIIKKISNDKMVYAKADYLTDLLASLPQGEKLNYLFTNTEGGEINVDDILTILKQTVQLITQSSVVLEDAKEYESVACFTQILNYLSDLQETYHCMDTITTLQRIYTRLAQRRSVPFYGEPLQGLQILGMLETRSLDFDRVILMSVNEGVLPKGRSNNSLIPLFLKRKHHIPTFEDKDAVYANHFYRLLQKANQIYLLYSSETEGVGKGEPSRFILQVCNELAERYPNINVELQVVYADNGETVQRPYSMAVKSERVQQRLKEKAEKGFAPTTLNNYRACPLAFYYKDIVGIADDNELKEELEANELGTCIHKILQNIYLTGNPTVEANHLKKALKEINNTVDNYFRDELLRGRVESGKNHIFNEVAKLQISHFLQKEIKLVEDGQHIEIKLLEEDLNHKLTLPSVKGIGTVTIKGTADRIDKVGNMLRIGDYKSGKVDGSELSVQNMTPDVMKVPDKWFQVMTYAWLYCRCHNLKEPFTAGIFPLRSLGADFMPVSWNGDSILTPSHIDRFEELLVTLLSSIMDCGDGAETFFSSTPRNSTICTYCPVKTVCNKIPK